MEAKRRNPYEYHPEYYVQGSTARKLAVVEPVRKQETEANVPASKEPERKIRQVQEPNRYERIRKMEEEQAAKHRDAYHQGVGFVSLVILTMAIVMTVYCALHYLNLVSEQNRLDKSIVALEKELTKLTNANAVNGDSITKNVDMDRIYAIAVAEMGMVFPKDNEVIYYREPDTGYVRQYADIPVVVKSILDELIH